MEEADKIRAEIKKSRRGFGIIITIVSAMS